MSDYNIGSSNRNSFNMVSRSLNPLESGVLVDKNVNIKIENISNAKLIEDQELNEIIIKPLQSIEDNRERLLKLESVKEPYLFTSKQVGAIVLTMMSLKTRMSIIEMLIPRVIDPTNTNQIKIFTDMFRFAADKATIEEMFKKHANMLNKSQYVLQVGNSSSCGLGLSPNHNTVGNNFQLRRGSASGALMRGNSGFHSPVANLQKHKSTNHIQYCNTIINDVPITSSSEIDNSTINIKSESINVLNAFDRFRQENSYVDEIVNRIEASKLSQKPILPDHKQTNYLGKYLDALKSATIVASPTASNINSYACTETDEAVYNQNISSKTISAVINDNRISSEQAMTNNRPFSTTKVNCNSSNNNCSSSNSNTTTNNNNNNDSNLTSVRSASDKVEGISLNTLIECSIQDLRTESNSIFDLYKIEFQRKIKYIEELENKLLEQELEHHKQLFELTAELSLSQSNLKYYLQSNQPSIINIQESNSSITSKIDNPTSLDVADGVKDDEQEKEDYMLEHREAVHISASHSEGGGESFASYAGPIIVRNDVSLLYTHSTSSKSDPRGMNHNTTTTNNNNADDIDPISGLLRDYSNTVAQLKCIDKELQYYKQLVINLKQSKNMEAIHSKELNNKVIDLSIRSNNLEKLLNEALTHCIQLSVELKFEKEHNKKLSKE